MARKSDSEIALIRESGRWCAHAHRLLQEYSRPGATEAEASLRAGQETTLAMLEALGESLRRAARVDRRRVRRVSRPDRPPQRVGARDRAQHPSFEPGDVLVTETSAPMWGYNAELERAMIIGPPTRRACAGSSTTSWPRSRSRSMRSGRASPAPTSTAQSCATSSDNDLLPYWRQHTGHAIGLRNHEAPFLDVGDHTPLETGMVFTIEPGLYDDRRSAASATRTPWSSPRTGSSSSRLPERHREA